MSDRLARFIYDEVFPAVLANPFVFSQATGHCDGHVFNQTLADTLVWIWRGYHAE